MNDFRSSTVDSLSTIVEGEVFAVDHHKQDTGFSVFRITSSDEVIKVVGIAFVEVGEHVSCSGRWKVSPKFGRQFDAINVVVRPPSSEAAITKYLASGAIKGIGLVWAGRIAKYFGPETISILDATPERLTELPGMGKKKASTIGEAWAAARGDRAMLLALAEYEIGTAVCHRIIKKYAKEALNVVQKEPYRLFEEVRGIGFTTADRIARQVGISMTSLERIRAGLRCVITEQLEGGSCGLKADLFVQKACTLLDLDSALVLPVLADAMKDRKFLIGIKGPDGLNYVFDKGLWDSEQEICAWVSDSIGLAPSWALTKEQAVAVAGEAEKDCGVDLAAEQAAAVVMALCSRVGVLTGGPGTGKTSTLKVILKALNHVRAQVVLAAPTGKAAKRMRETTGHPASTVAKLIGMGSPVEPPEIDADVVVVDEASMLDVKMLAKLLGCLSEHTSLLLVGDVDQLASVSPGNVLGDMIDSGSVPTVRLVKVFRQAEQSAIIRNAHRINKGLPIEGSGGAGSDFFFIKASSEKEITDTVTDLVSRRLPAYLGLPASDIQVLSPMKKSGTGVQNLNLVLQQTLNPPTSESLVRGSRSYGVGDRLLMTANDYDADVMNGECGVVVSIDKGASMMRIRFDEREVDLPFDKLDSMELAYAMSVHKSQGSQFPAVVMPVTTQHSVMLKRSIVYTGVTRASKLCVLVGQEKALNMAIRDMRVEPRITTLKWRLEKIKGRVVV